MAGSVPLVLASSSPRRKQVLEQIGITPDLIISPDIDETHHKGEQPKPYALRMATEKAAKAASLHPDKLCLCADTVVAVGRRILPKGETEADFDHCWALLPGRRHQVHTAVALYVPGRGIFSKIDSSTVQMRRLSAAELHAYKDSRDWVGKAGAYSIQGPAALFVTAIHGQQPSIVGLPIPATAALLRAAGYPVMGHEKNTRA